MLFRGTTTVGPPIYLAYNQHSRCHSRRPKSMINIAANYYLKFCVLQNTFERDLEILYCPGQNWIDRLVSLLLIAVIFQVRNPRCGGKRRNVPPPLFLCFSLTADSYSLMFFFVTFACNCHFRNISDFFSRIKPFIQ